MSIITLATARAHLRVVGTADDVDIQLKLSAAELSAAAFLQRGIYVDAAALATAVAAAPAAFTATIAALKTREEAAEALEDCTLRALELGAVATLRTAAATAYRFVVNGIVINDAITAACLLTLGALFENREEVVAGTIVAQLPWGATALLQPYRISVGV